MKKERTMPTTVKWQILLLQDGGWINVWSVSLDNETELKTAVLYGMNKVLDGSDADAFMLVRSDTVLPC